MMIGRLRVFSSVVLATSLGAALNGCGSDDDTTGGSGGHSAKGGRAGRGGTSGTSGTSGRGGSVSTGGSVATGGTGGSFAGTGGTGGSVSTTGGSGGLATGGTAGGGTSGGTSLGGMAGNVASAGAGGTGGAPSYCYEALYAPIAMENDQVDFEVDYGDAGAVDLSATTLSVRLRAETAGNAGGVQVYVKNGTAQNFAAAYLGWNNLTDLTNFTTLTYDLSTATGGTGFDINAIRYVGINVNAGSTFDGASFQPATIYVDSITFSDGASADLNFNDGVNLLAVNKYNNPVAGSAVSAGICQIENGTGGMGGMSATGGMGGISATGGTSGTEGGAAGEGGALGGEGGVDQGTGGSATGGTSGAATGGSSGSGTGGSSGSGATAGTSSGGMSGTGGGASGSGGGGMSGTSGVGGSTSGAGGVSGAAGRAGAGGSSGGGTNLISNGDFELGVTTGWSSWSPATFQVSSTAHAGNYSMLVTGRSGGNPNILTNITSVVSAGHSYTVTAWVRASAATSGHFTVQFDCATIADEFVWVENAVNFGNGGWTQITGTFDNTGRCTGDTVSAVNLYLEGMATGIDVYLDDVSMTQN
jgi:hypothetical protein